MINSELAHSLVDEYRGKKIEVSDMLCLLSDYDSYNTRSNLIDLAKEQQETIQLQAENIERCMRLDETLRKYIKTLEEYVETLEQSEKVNKELHDSKVKFIKSEVLLYNLKSGLYRLFKKCSV